MTEMTPKQRMVTALEGTSPIACGDDAPRSGYFLRQVPGRDGLPRFFDEFGFDPIRWLCRTRRTNRAANTDPTQTTVHPLDLTHRVVSDVAH